jgi:hypothetical protein
MLISSFSYSLYFVLFQGMTSFFINFKFFMNWMVVEVSSKSSRGDHFPLTSLLKLSSLSQFALNLKGEVMQEHHSS